MENPYFGAVIFRRETPQIKNKGAMWDQSTRLYGMLNARPRQDTTEWFFPLGSTVKFSHLEHENTVLNYQGAEIPYIGFDELTHFTRYQFTYMLSRNRSTCGVTPYIRATCNPDPDSWVRELVDWWIGPDGYPLMERSGRLRWFVNIEDKFHWADTKTELEERYGRDSLPLSFTFIPAALEDNKILMRKDPTYKAKLNAMGKVDRERLMKGNWNIRATGGNFFRREWFPVVDAIPGGWVSVVRFWDRAATRPSPSNRDPDWTRGGKIYSYPNGKWCVGDLKSIRDTPGNVDRFIKTVATQDGFGVKIRAQQDPGSAGKKEAEAFMAMLAGFDVSVEVMTGDKATRARPLSAQCEFGNVSVLRAPWNDELFYETENFSEDPKDYAHDDIVDCLSGGFNSETQGRSILDVTTNLSRLFGEDE